MRASQIRRDSKEPPIPFPLSGSDTQKRATDTLPPDRALPAMYPLMVPEKSAAT